MASFVIAAILGFLLVVYLIVDSGAAKLAQAMLLIGWWLIPITLLHVVPLVFSALSWRELISAASRPKAFTAVWIRWIRESINSLLPVASVGGDVASFRLASLQGVPVGEAAASMVVDTTLGVVTQLIFVMSGVVLLLLTRSAERNMLGVAVGISIGMAVLLVATGAFVMVQRRGLFGGLEKIARRLLPATWSASTVGASAIDDAIMAVYRSRSTMMRASTLRLLGWAAGAGEVWLVMWGLGQPIDMADAFILESLTSGVRAAAFIVPGALGALETSFVLFGALFGLPPDTALAISLSKRVRELALGAPGLLLWYRIETRFLLRRAEPIPT